MKYLVSEVERWGKEIDALPAPDPGRRKVGKKEAVFLLAKKLQRAARRGFSTAELLEVLASKGLTVHVDTIRAALKVGGLNRKIIGASRRLPDGNGTEAQTTTGRLNAGVTDGDRSEHGTNAGPELALTLGQGGGGEAAEAEVEKDPTDAAWDVGGFGGDEFERRADVGPDARPTGEREEIGEMSASRDGKGGSALGIGRGLTGESGGAELVAPKLQDVAAAPGVAGVDEERRARLRNRSRRQRPRRPRRRPRLLLSHRPPLRRDRFRGPQRLLAPVEVRTTTKEQSVSCATLLDQESATVIFLRSAAAGACRTGCRIRRWSFRRGGKGRGNSR